MKLKAIDIHGFKSFPDRTRLEFTDGITAVVGPNGSGKSNIADAVRWVLGEQSTRTLRGVRMEDVIFNGTQSRKAQGIASVTLFIDNKARALPYDEDVVSVSRRLFRSGESEYRINGVMVRLKDIYEMFMDTGLGRDGYSIIGQGKIAEIVSAKDKERREIFEEAAGIAKFRYRKTEAERRLAMAQENMLRLKDILSELESRLEPLKRESARAEAYLGLAREKRALEVSVWVHSIASMRTALGRQTELMQEARASLEREDLQTEADESAIAELAERMQRCAVEIETLREQQKSASGQLTQWESDKAVWQNDIQHNVAGIEEARREIDAAGQDREGLAEELARKLEDIEQKRLESEALRGRLEEAAAALDGIQARQNRLSEEADRLRLRRGGLFEQIEKAKLQAASSASLISETESRLGGLSADTEARQQNLQRICGEIESCRQLQQKLAEEDQTLANSMQGYQLKRQSRQDKLNEQQKQQDALRGQAAELRQKARLLVDLDKNMEGFASSVKYIVKQGETGQLRGLHGPISRLIQTDDRCATAIETALGQAMQNIVVDDEEVAKRAIRMLASSKAGRATFLPLTSVRGTPMAAGALQKEPGFVGIASALVRCEAEYRGVADWLLGRIVVADDLDSAVAMAKKDQYRHRIVTLDGQMVNAGGSMTGGYTARSAGILSRQREIERLGSQAKEKDRQADALNVQIEKLTGELESLSADIVALEARRKTVGEDGIRCETEQRQLKNALREAEAAMESASEEERQLTLRIGEMRAAGIGAAELLAVLDRDMESVQSEIAALAEQAESARQEAAACAAGISELTTGDMLCQKDMQMLRLAAEQLQERLSAGEKRNAELSGRAEALKVKNDEIALRIEQLILQSEALTAQCGRLQQAIQALMREREDCERRTAQLRAALKQTAARRELAYRDLVRFEEKCGTLQNEYDDTVARLWDEYELTLTQAQNEAAGLDDPQKAARQLSELRNRIKAMGSVNLGAIDECREVNARYTFLSDQLSDVERSVTELTRLIGELTEQMRDIFSQNFTRINQSFGVIFAELFGGGKANLALTDPGDVLNSGIEIVVQPPGKLIKNLAELSGGEQAFVAIAIYFAILRVNPAPFCMLDEIEATLDDVNVVKFAQYMRRMSSKTQFIAITHRRGTMEEADVLYGVTMQEEGVSKLLRLNVAEVEGKLGIR